MKTLQDIIKELEADMEKSPYESLLGSKNQGGIRDAATNAELGRRGAYSVIITKLKLALGEDVEL